MRLSLLVALAPLALAGMVEKRQQPPTCAIGCFATLTTTPGPCKADDIVCLCTNTEVQNTMLQCLTTSCAPDQIATAAQYAQGLCSQAGVQLPDARVASSISSAVASSSVAVGSSAASGTSLIPSSAGSGPTGTTGISASVSSALAPSASRTSAAWAAPTAAVHIGAGAVGVLLAAAGAVVAM